MPNHAVQILRWQATVILTLFFTAVAGAAALGWWYARDSPPHQGPLVLVAVDGLSHDSLAPPTAPAAGDTASVPDVEQEPASALQMLAADSVVFDRAYTHSPHLLPAYASLLAGRLPFEHGVRDEAGFSLPGEVRTLAELLRNRGFATAAAVSSPLLRREAGIAQGFSFFHGPEAGDPLARIDKASTPGDTDAEASPGVIDAAETWARAQENQRYFLLLQVDAHEADAVVSRVTELLHERGSYARSTIVLVGSRARSGTGAALDEDTLLVPMLVKQPNSEHAGRRVDALVQHVDVLPTLLDLVRAPLPGGLRGRSLKPLLTDDNGRIAPQPIYAESLAAFYRFGGAPLFALTMNDVRYVQGSTESLVRLDAGTDPDAPADGGAGEGRAGTGIEPLRATLDRLIAQDVPAPAAPIAAADIERVARAGYLQGLPASLEPQTGTGLGVRAQKRLLDAHQASAQLFGERRYGTAVRSLQALARLNPGIADLHYQIGVVGLRGDRTPEALASLREAAASRPDSPEVASLLALVLARANRVDEARLEAERAVSMAADLEPERLAAAHETAARLAMARDDREAAEEHATAAEQLVSSRPIRTFVDAAWRAKDSDPGAAAVFEKAVRHLRQHDAAPLEGLHLGLADALVAEDRMEEAEAAFREEIRAFPASVDAYTRLAALYHASARSDAADAAIRVLLDEVPTRASYAAAAQTWAALGERARADAVRLEARERFRGDPVPAPRPRDGLR
jgi:tetratricopeptide (TPR) repeat protein